MKTAITSIALTIFVTAAISTVPQSAQAAACFGRLITEAVDPHFQDAAPRECDEDWQGTLPNTNTPARIMVEQGLSIPADLPNRVLAGLKKAEAAIPQLGSGISAGYEMQLAVSSVEDPSSLAGAIFHRGRCYIIVYPKSWRTRHGLTDLEFTLAHELFHCVQSASISSVSNAGYRHGEDQNAWWTEGTAEWFAHLAVSGAPHAADTFELSISQAPLSRMGQYGWVFWSWYAERFGNDRVMPLLQALPPRVHTPRLVATVLTPEEWGDFAKTYSAFKVRTPDGRVIRPTSRFTIPVETIDADKSVQVERHVAELMRQKQVIDEGVWEITGDPDAVAFISPLNASGDPEDTWQRIGSAPVELDVPCGEQKSFAIAAFSTTDRPFEYKAKRTGSTCELSCAPVETPADSCLLGTWVMADFPEKFLSSRFVKFFESELREVGGEITDVTMPPPVVSMFEDGTFTVDNPMKFSGQGKDDGVTIKMSFDFAANQDSGRWGSDGSNLLICPQKSSAAGTVSVSVGSYGTQTMPIDNTEIIADEPQGQATYTCSGDTVQLVTPDIGVLESMNLTLKRIAGPEDVSRD